VECILADHSKLETVLMRYPHFVLQTAAVVMNLGYLPQSDRLIVTTPAATVLALQQSLQLLKPGGLLSITAYKGHAGGHEEAEAVCEWFATQLRLRQLQSVQCIKGSVTHEDSPKLLLGYKTAQHA
jgi:hypothetical protein